MSNSLQPHGRPWHSLGQNTGVDSLSLLQGIFPTQGLNSGLHCRQILYRLSHKGSPRILEWVAYPFSSGSSRSRNWTGVSCNAGKFFTNWAIREALHSSTIITITMLILQMNKQFEELKKDMEKITKKHTYSIQIMRSLYLDSIFNILNFPVAKKPQ